MKKLGKWFNSIENLLACLGTIVGLLLIFVNVVMRYILHNPLAWIDEVSVIVLTWSIIIGFSIDLGERSHICMDVVYDAVKSKAIRRGMDLFALLVGLLYSSFITIYGFQAVALQFRTGRIYPLTELPQWIAYLIIIIVGVVMVGRYLINLVQFFRGTDRQAKEG